MRRLDLSLAHGDVRHPLITLKFLLMTGTTLQPPI